MGEIASQIISLTIVYSTVYSDADQRKHQSFASLAFVRRIHRGPVNSPHKWPVTRKMFPFDDVIMGNTSNQSITRNNISPVVYSVSCVQGAKHVSCKSMHNMAILSSQICIWTSHIICTPTGLYETCMHRTITITMQWCVSVLGM